MEKTRKRVDIVKIKLVKERSVLYNPRKINSPEHAFKLVQDFLKDIDREAFVVVNLDTKNQPTSMNLCSIGTISSTLVHPREVFKSAILSNTSRIIIAHNHPSGDIEASQDDIVITKRLKEAGEIVGIEIVDHIIIGDEKFLSFKEQQLI